MPRPCKRRRVCKHPTFNEFVANGSLSKDVVYLSVDEFECLRLLDYEKITQEECAIKMNVARTTVTAIYQDARYKLMDSLINGKRLVIQGGNYELCSEHNNCRGYNCLTKDILIIERKENIVMRIAVTYENNEVFQHFGRTQQFKIYDVEGNNVVASYILDSNGAGHGALADVLARNRVDVLLCGGIGNGAVNALVNYNIKVAPGAMGNCDEVVNMFINNKLNLDGTSNCNHHHHDHHDGHECHCHEHHHEHHEDHECHCHEHGEHHECHCHDKE